MTRHFTFYQAENDFTDILSDPSIKKHICTKVSWNKYLLIGIKEYGDDEVNKIATYINIKYGDYLKNNIVPDRSPVMNVDYIPKRD